ncbi:hypothetical protein A2U01_0113847, partial [Trifolium medium]|nr:hypothetical protein [Trifolium medium]
YQMMKLQKPQGSQNLWKYQYLQPLKIQMLKQHQKME